MFKIHNLVPYTIVQSSRLTRHIIQLKLRYSTPKTITLWPLTEERFPLWFSICLRRLIPLITAYFSNAWNLTLDYMYMELLLTTLSHTCPRDLSPCLFVQQPPSLSPNDWRSSGIGFGTVAICYVHHSFGWCTDSAWIVLSFLCWWHSDLHFFSWPKMPLPLLRGFHLYSISSTSRT